MPNPRGSKLREIQNDFQNAMGFTIPFFFGRGIFQYNWGLMPKRIPLISVVGAPIDCPKIAEPTQADVDKYHDLYVNALQELYNQHKDIYARERKRSLMLVD
eukprot:Colp12_sorted_trinity150504_noHs@33055